ncbi:3-hydroxyacyl-[acyl-carrier-protein] dehydratase [Pseudochelatococcus lubricantis]|uniref:3-hydroxyacyl-[acyl-carrier-protein] dehydratase FabZ n=1 Tax=Pseudochelatococcus lubricantis TaxID=1538102 RepID=A0ABX0V1D0_9HYPH|nr:3-hydroxyacyl-ACP dehydratase FabZ [Pseudochelatococcus lubricantis]NIJ58423.1 3-hydroxyacyl-[acyl-carrier-protein] dehydratase [Pseudochelatococcus lubricantis]
MTDVPSNLNTADILQILSYLPHRYPFLLIDRIIEMNGDESCIGIKNVTYNEPQFQGHFPSRPLFPGVFMIEGMAQTAGAICVASKLAEKARPKEVYFMTIDKVKFRKPVEPGDVVHYHMKKLANRRNMWWYRGEARVNGALVCEAELAAMLVIE